MLKLLEEEVECKAGNWASLNSLATGTVTARTFRVSE